MWRTFGATLCSSCCKVLPSWITCVRRFGRNGGGGAIMQQTDSTETDKGFWRVLELPVPVVLVSMWLIGTVIVCACLLTLYALVSLA